MKKIIASILCLILCTAMVLSAVAETPSVAVVVAGSLGDESFYDSSNEGAVKLHEDFGTVYTVIECRENGSLYESSLYDAAESYDIICAVGWQFCDFLVPGSGVLAEYPDKKFLFIDNDCENAPENLMPVVYSQNEGSFLAGYIAASLSQTGKIGVVGGEDSPTINDFIVGYEAGAKYYNPDIEVMKNYVNSFEDPAGGKEKARALYDAGCDVVFQVAGSSGEGVFKAAAEVGKYAIGVDGDQKYINPDVIVCSMMKLVGKSIYDVVSDPDTYWKGGQTWHADMATGYIDVVYGTEDMVQQVSDETKAEVVVLKEKIINGEIVVPTALN